MSSPSQMHIAMARWLLELEGGSSPDERALAAGRVYDKLHLHLAPLLGKAGVELMLIRSAKSVQGELAFLTESSILGGAAKLRERLQPPAPSLSADTVAALFGTFLALLMTFIGERLTNQVLRSAWPTLNGLVSGERTS